MTVRPYSISAARIGDVVRASWDDEPHQVYVVVGLYPGLHAADFIRAGGESVWGTWYQAELDEGRFSLTLVHRGWAGDDDAG